jgi:hypothetical protein
VSYSPSEIRCQFDLEDDEHDGRSLFCCIAGRMGVPSSASRSTSARRSARSSLSVATWSGFTSPSAVGGMGRSVHRAHAVIMRPNGIRLRRSVDEGDIGTDRPDTAPGNLESATCDEAFLNRPGNLTAVAERPQLTPRDFSKPAGSHPAGF